MADGGEELLREAEELIETWLCEMDAAHAGMVADATGEATRIVADAEQHAQRLGAVARDEAEEIVAAAHLEARRIMADVESSAARRRAELEVELDRRRAELVALSHPPEAVDAPEAEPATLADAPDPGPAALEDAEDTASDGVELGQVEPGAEAVDAGLLTALWAAAQPSVATPAAVEAPANATPPSVLGSDPLAIDAPGAHRRKRRRLFGLGRR